MAKRIDRSVPQSVRQKISDSLKAYYKKLSVEKKQERAAAHSEQMKKYWSAIPKVSGSDCDGHII